MATEPLITLRYVSRSLIDGDLGALARLRREAVEHNARHDITGALYFDSLTFFQVLEGPRDAVSALMARIAADPRHTDVVELGREPITRRLFDGWSMKFVSGAVIPQRQERFAYDAVRAADAAAISGRVAELRAA